MEGATSEVVRETAGRTRLGLTLWDVNISFKHFLYYWMSRSDGGVVTKEYLVMKPSRGRSSA